MSSIAIGREASVSTPRASQNISVLHSESSPRFEEAIEVLRTGTIVAITGAGISTDSGIPDYRGEGTPVRTPMTFQEFLSNDERRKRYWAGSHLGWRRFDAARPNAGHRALARLEAAGVVNGVITQNVDGLHLGAGSRRVVDLHGSLDRVRCLQCGQLFARADIALRLTTLNPWLDVPEAVELAPDGDVMIADVGSFTLPVCTVCGGMLKPDVVFFGEFVPVQKFAEASSLLQAADAVLVAGSSLAVNSAIRLLEQAHRRRLPIVIINRGATKGDARASVKIDFGASQTLEALANRLIG